MFIEQRLNVTATLSEPIAGEQGAVAFDGLLELLQAVHLSALLRPLHAQMNKAGLRGAWIEQTVPRDGDPNRKSWYRGDADQTIVFRIVYASDRDDLDVRATASAVSQTVIEDGLFRFNERLAHMTRTATGAEARFVAVADAPDEPFPPLEPAPAKPWRVMPLLAKASPGDHALEKRAELRAAFVETAKDLSGFFACTLRPFGLVPGRIDDLGEDAAVAANGGRALTEYFAEHYRRWGGMPVIPALFGFRVRRPDGGQIDAETARSAWQAMHTRLSGETKPFLMERLESHLRARGWTHRPAFELQDLPTAAKAWKRWRAFQNGKALPQKADAETRAAAIRTLQRFADAYGQALPAVRDDEGALARQGRTEWQRLKSLKNNDGLAKLPDAVLRRALASSGRIATAIAADVREILPDKAALLRTLAKRAEETAAGFPLPSVVHCRHDRQREI